MNIVQRIRSLFEKRQSVLGADPYTTAIFGARQNASGQPVTPDRAEGVPAVAACVAVIAETVASLPLNVYRRTDNGGRALDTSHPLHRVLHEQSNRVQTAMEFREQLTAS